MTKAHLEQFLQTCKEAGIEKWTLRFEGGNRSVTHGNDSTRIILRDDDLIIIEPTHNYATPNGQFNITTCTYEMIDNVRVLDVPFAESIDIFKGLGIYDEELEDMVKHSVKRQPIIPGTGGFATIKDSEGNDVIPPGSSGYITE
jgi:hypothetical protein